jgi:hypothetical protein
VTFARTSTYYEIASVVSLLRKDITAQSLGKGRPGGISGNSFSNRQIDRKFEINLNVGAPVKTGRE